jgi:hypothetical protein
VAEVLATVEPRIGRLLERRGPGEDDDVAAADPWVETAPVLAGLAAAGAARPPPSSG